MVFHTQVNLEIGRSREEIGQRIASPKGEAQP
jgi:hypothetical protein